MSKYWVCIIGPVDEKTLRPDANKIMKSAVKDAFIEVTGEYAPTVYSSFNVSEFQRPSIEGRIAQPHEE